MVNVNFGGERAAAVVTDVDQQVFAVAVPVRPDPGDIRLFHHDQHQPPDDCPCCVRNFSGEGPAVQGRFDELDFDAAEARERAQVFAQAFEGFGHRFFDQICGAVAVRAEAHQCPGGALRDRGVRRGVVHGGLERRAARCFQGGRVEIGQFGRHADAFDCLSTGFQQVRRRRLCHFLRIRRAVMSQR